MDPIIAIQLKNLQQIIDIQATSGNWDYDPYMFGLLNGMLFARSLLDGKDPGFKSAPEVWLSDYAELEKLALQGVVFNDICVLHRPKITFEEDL